MRVLVACEFSGAVRDAFIRAGHQAMSCDLLPSETDGPHYQGDIRDMRLPGIWELLVAFPPCTHLALSGARWWPSKRHEQTEAIDFVRYLWHSGVYRICIENPVGILSREFDIPTQIIQPWQFGHGEQKTTCLWLHNLPALRATHIVAGRAQRILNMPQSAHRAHERSRTYSGIAAAMATQWGI